MDNYILMIEDDCYLGEALYDFLIQEGFRVDIAEDATSGIAKASISPYNAVILDLSLPDLDGLKVCKKIRAIKPHLPILISTARGELSDKQQGYELGADDYLAKPYAPQELVWRLQALLKRSAYVPLSTKKEDTPVMGFALHEESKDLFFDGKPQGLTVAEFHIMVYLIRQSPRVVAREEILSHVNELRSAQTTKTVDVLIGRIRAKIGDDAKNPRYILAIRGYGYRWNEN